MTENGILPDERVSLRAAFNLYKAWKRGEIYTLDTLKIEYRDRIAKIDAFIRRVPYAPPPILRAEEYGDVWQRVVQDATQAVRNARQWFVVKRNGRWETSDRTLKHINEAIHRQPDWPRCRAWIAKISKTTEVKDDAAIQ